MFKQASKNSPTVTPDMEMDSNDSHQATVASLQHMHQQSSPGTNNISTDVTGSNSNSNSSRRNKRKTISTKNAAGTSSSSTANSSLGTNPNGYKSEGERNRRFRNMITSLEDENKEERKVEESSLALPDPTTSNVAQRSLLLRSANGTSAAAAASTGEGLIDSSLGVAAQAVGGVMAPAGVANALPPIFSNPANAAFLAAAAAGLPGTTAAHAATVGQQQVVPGPQAATTTVLQNVYNNMEPHNLAAAASIAPFPFRAQPPAVLVPHPAATQTVHFALSPFHALATAPTDNNTTALQQTLQLQLLQQQQQQQQLQQQQVAAIGIPPAFLTAAAVAAGTPQIPLPLPIASNPNMATAAAAAGSVIGNSVPSTGTATLDANTLLQPYYAGLTSATAAPPMPLSSTTNGIQLVQQGQQQKQEQSEAFTTDSNDAGGAEGSTSNFDSNSNGVPATSSGTSTSATSTTTSDVKSLSLPTDYTHLTPYQVALRKQIIIREANEEDILVDTQGRKIPLSLGQAGIQCKHCKDMPFRHRGKGSVYYPKSLDGLYQACQNMSRNHLRKTCKSIHPDVLEQLNQARCARSRAIEGTNYWADGGKQLGLYEDNGKLFVRR